LHPAGTTSSESNPRPVGQFAYFFVYWNAFFIRRIYLLIKENSASYITEMKLIISEGIRIANWKNYNNQV